MQEEVLPQQDEFEQEQQEPEELPEQQPVLHPVCAQVHLRQLFHQGHWQEQLRQLFHQGHWQEQLPEQFVEQITPLVVVRMQPPGQVEV